MKPKENRALKIKKKTKIAYQKYKTIPATGSADEATNQCDGDGGGHSAMTTRVYANEGLMTRLRSFYFGEMLLTYTYL